MDQVDGGDVCAHACARRGEDLAGDCLDGRVGVLVCVQGGWRGQRACERGQRVGREGGFVANGLHAAGIGQGSVAAVWGCAAGERDDLYEFWKVPAVPLFAPHNL